MSRGAQPTQPLRKAVTAFEVEIESFWVRLTQVKPGRRVEVWLTPRWSLEMRYFPMSVQVGVYTREVQLSDFRADCFWMLEQGRAA